MSNIKKIEEYDINEAKKDDKSLTAKEYLFNIYKKYYTDAKSFVDIENEDLPMTRVAKLMEEYHELKSKQ
jgi:hypothetical protein